ncbi:MAG: hypothetical protein ACLR3C_07285 [Eggerthella lenta]
MAAARLYLRDHRRNGGGYRQREAAGAAALAGGGERLAGQRFDLRVAGLFAVGLAGREGAPFPSEGCRRLVPVFVSRNAAFCSNTANGDSSSTVMLARPFSTATFAVSGEPSAFRWVIRPLSPS